MRKTARRGSALRDVLIAAAIFAALASLLIYPFEQAKRASNAANCASYGKQIGTGLQMYLADYDSRFPPRLAVEAGERQTVPALLYPYLKNGGIWACPLASAEYTYDSRSPADTTVSYGYNGLALEKNGIGIKLSAIKNPSWTVAFAESTSYFAAPAPLAAAAGATPPLYRHRERATVVWVDGHVKWYYQPELECAPGTEQGKPLKPGIDAYDQWNLR